MTVLDVISEYGLRKGWDFYVIIREKGVFHCNDSILYNEYIDMKVDSYKEGNKGTLIIRLESKDEKRK